MTDFFSPSPLSSSAPSKKNPAKPTTPLGKLKSRICSALFCSSPSAALVCGCEILQISGKNSHDSPPFSLKLTWVTPICACGSPILGRFRISPQIAAGLPLACSSGFAGKILLLFTA
ncbi:hypothetical protein SLEP1_g22609 [Rubroshorea leprosula]|uniref:Uncharacterized protein n=1 Tax=Rubroshorea leprosula TaxID=152421 RepID=A0AAV5JF28_9ROSI|nr:hypothetical protein SLEP1_g22609 [Rubroshorea leprosula]